MVPIIWESVITALIPCNSVNDSVELRATENFILMCNAISFGWVFVFVFGWVFVFVFGWVFVFVSEAEILLNWFKPLCKAELATRNFSSGWRDHGASFIIFPGS